MIYLSFSFSFGGKGLARDFARESSRRKRGGLRRRRQLLILLKYRDFKSYYHQHIYLGVTSGEPLFDRGQGPRAFPPLVPAGKDCASSVSVRDWSAMNDRVSPRTSLSFIDERFVELSYLIEGIRAFCVNRKFHTIKWNTRVRARAYILYIRSIKTESFFAHISRSWLYLF